MDCHRRSLSRAVHVSPESVEWTKGYLSLVTSKMAKAQGLEWVLCFLWKTYDLLGPPFTVITVAAVVYALVRRRPLAAFFGAALAGLMLVACNAKLWNLPYSFLLYYNRSVNLLVVPLAVSGTPEQYATDLDKEVMLWAKVVKESGAKAN